MPSPASDPYPVTLTPRTDLPPDARSLSGAAVDAFVSLLGGRQALVSILLIASGDPAVDQVVALLDDPLYAGWSLPRLCLRAGLTVADFLRAYQRAMLARGEIAAARVIADRMVAVVDDVMRRAAPYDEACPCGAPAVVSVPPNPPCKACRGTGVLHLQPDLDRQKVALELAKLLTKGGILVQQNTLAVGNTGQQAATTGSIPASSLTDLQTAVQTLLRRPRPSAPPVPDPPTAPIVDATLVEDPP